MGLNNGSRVAASRPKVGGGVYWAPLGSTLPTDATTDLDAAFVCLGPVSEDGVQPSRDTSVERVREWDGSTLATLLSDENRAFEFTLLGAHDEDALSFVHGAANVTVTAAVTGATPSNTKLAVTDKGGQLAKGVLVLEMTHAGAKQRKVVPVAQPNVTGENAYVPGGLRGWTVSVEAEKDDSGNFSLEYADLGDVV